MTSCYFGISLSDYMEVVSINDPLGGNTQQYYKGLLDFSKYFKSKSTYHSLNKYVLSFSIFINPNSLMATEDF